MKVTFKRLDNSGHTALEYETETKTGEHSLAEAEAQFNEWMEEGYEALATYGPNQGKVLTTFDPLAESVVFITPLKAG